jgi:hypothetical protein
MSDEVKNINKKDEKKDPVQGGKILGMFPEEAVPNWAMGLMATFFMFIVGFIMLVQFGGFQPMQASLMDGYSKMQEAQVFKVKEMTKIDIEERRAKIQMMKNGKIPSSISDTVKTNHADIKDLQEAIKRIDYTKSVAKLKYDVLKIQKQIKDK